MVQEKRDYYKPFEYPWAYDLYRDQQLVHWTKDEIKLSEDLQNWNFDLSVTEKNVIGGILKGFVQMEVLIGDYWRRVSEWFPKPEIQMMASTFSYFENIHIDNYALLNEELNLTDFKSFNEDSDTATKLAQFIDVREGSLADKARSLAIFSAFGEGVLVFSSFAVLLSFQRENLMKGLGQIISFSIRDENTHSIGGCKLFNTICEENPGLLETIKDDIYKSAEYVEAIEAQFIDNLFFNNPIRTLDKEDLKNFIRARINLKLKDIGLNGIFAINEVSYNNMQWFYMLSSGREFSDFFSTRVTEYTKYEIDPSDIF